MQWGGTRQRPHISRAAENKNWHGGLFVCVWGGGCYVTGAGKGSGHWSFILAATLWAAIMAEVLLRERI